MHSPCQLHRTEKLAAIPVQSGSSFLDVEVLAKATFLGHLLERGRRAAAARARSFAQAGGAISSTVLQRPLFRRPAAEPASGPAENAQGQVEGADGPGREDGDRLDDVGMEEAGPFEQDQPQGADELGQREGLDHVLGASGRTGPMRRRRRRAGTSAA